MARTPTRTRKVLLAITLAMLVMVLAAWGVSYWRSAWIDHTAEKWFPTTPNVPLPLRGMSRHEYHELRLNYARISVVATTTSSSLLNVPALHTKPDPPGWSYGIEEAFRGGTHLIVSPPIRSQGAWSILGVTWHWYADARVDEQGVVVELWLLAAILAIAAFWLWWPQRRSARRRADGLCLRCGYDRRGLALAASCPECGETPAPAPPAA